MSPADRDRDDAQAAEDRDETTYRFQAIEAKDETEEWEKAKQNPDEDD